jgi:hypothetical protein
MTQKSRCNKESYSNVDVIEAYLKENKKSTNENC